MDRREYTPTKNSQILNSITNTQAQTYQKHHTDYHPTYTKNTPDYSRQQQTPDLNIAKQYETLKMHVKQMQYQNRQLSTQAQKLRYEKNLNDNKYLQKLSYEEETMNQFQKEKNYQMELMKIKGDEDINKTKREFQMRLDELQREMKARDYQNREINEKNAYLQLKNNELKKGAETLQGELIKFRQNNANLSDYLSKQEFTKKKLQMLTDELQRQKCEMQSQIHVLLDIQAQKSRTANSLQVQLKNSETTERCLHQKLVILTQNFTNLEQHIAIMKERLLNADLRNQQLQKQLQSNSLILSDKQNCIAEQKDHQIHMKNELERQQNIEMRRQNELKELLNENQRLFKELNYNRQRLHEICISQGIDM